MNPRPRSTLNSHGIDNLYIKHDKRTGRYYAQYKDIRSGRFYGLGAGDSLDCEGIRKAKQRATHLNTLITNQIADAKTHSILDNRPARSLITVSGWLIKYMRIQKERLSDGEIKPATLRSRKSMIKKVDACIGSTPLTAVTVKQIKDDLIDVYKDQGMARTAKGVRSVLIDIFNEAMQAGEVPEGFNPAKATKSPWVKVQRARLTLDAFNMILKAAETHCDPWIVNAMLLALVTGQRREDIGRMMFSQINGEFLEVIQEKGGSCIKIPLSLTMDVIGCSVGEILKRCRDRVISRYVIHHTVPRSYSKRGDAVHIDSISRGFSRARGKTDLEWPGFTPPTFHEMRSLAEREYRKQGIDTQALLGHKEAKTTDLYHDARGHDWVVVDAK